MSSKFASIFILNLKIVALRMVLCLWLLFVGTLTFFLVIYSLVDKRNKNHINNPFYKTRKETKQLSYYHYTTKHKFK